MEDRYIVLEVTYRKDADYGMSLGWVAPALKDAAGLEMTEDDTDQCDECGQGRVVHDAGTCDPDELEDHPYRAPEEYPHRKWAGVVTGDEWAKLASDWSIDPEDSEPNLGILGPFGVIEAEAYNWDGMDWNAGGETPIAYVSLYASVPAGE